MTVAYADAAAPADRIPFARARRLALLVWQFLIGVVFCQTLLGSVVAVGWTYRWMQRSALRSWWRQSGRERYEGDFAAIAASDVTTAPHVHAPAWFVDQSRRASAEGTGAGRWLRHLLGSLWLNLRIGLHAITHTLVITGPAAALWVFSWYAGWDNSFNKGYEQAPVGPLTGLAGVALFIAAMMYVPMAQVRHAVSGDWRAFYAFRLNWRLTRACWVSMLMLAGLYALASVPIQVVRVFPYFLHLANPSFAEMSAVQQIDFMNRYYFWTTVLMLLSFIVVRLVATRIYAAGVVRGLRRGRIQLAELSPFEQRALERLGLATHTDVPGRHALVRAVVGGSAWAARMAATVALVVVWFAFTAQIFVAQFLNYQPIRAWVNQPLVHAPWLKFNPSHLHDRAANPD